MTKSVKDVEAALHDDFILHAWGDEDPDSLITKCGLDLEFVPINHHGTYRLKSITLFKPCPECWGVK